MEVMITLTGNPISTNSLYRHRGHITYMTAEGKQTKTKYQWEAKTQWRGFKCLTGALQVGITLYFKNNRVHDIDNYNKLLLDALTGIVYADDKQIEELNIQKKIDKVNPRIEVEVNEI